MSGPGSIIGANAVRIARLTADGTPDFNNPVGGFMLCGGISAFQHDYDVEVGPDIFERDAGGNACVIRKRDDTVKRVTFQLTMCRSDYRIDEILGLSTNISNAQAQVVGRAMKIGGGCGTVVAKPRVSIELWSEQWDCDVPAARPYMRTVLGAATLTPAGFKRDNGVSLPIYKGYSVYNPNFGDGPFGDLDLLVGVTGWGLIDIDNDVIPACPSPIGYVNIPGSAS